MDIGILLNAEIEECYWQFVDALKMGNLAVLEKIYAEDYLLVRPNGDILSKREILADLKAHHMLLGKVTTPSYQIHDKTQNNGKNDYR
jgi:ketosteroid isomerase-like protein